MKSDFAKFIPSNNKMIQELMMYMTKLILLSGQGVATCTPGTLPRWNTPVPPTWPSLLSMGTSRWPWRQRLSWRPSSAELTSFFTPTQVRPKMSLKGVQLFDNRPQEPSLLCNFKYQRGVVGCSMPARASEGSHPRRISSSSILLYKR